jgi:hypothetical protein
MGKRKRKVLSQFKAEKFLQKVRNFYIEDEVLTVPHIYGQTGQINGTLKADK